MIPPTRPILMFSETANIKIPKLNVKITKHDIKFFI